MEKQDFIIYLNEELSRRIDNNGSYSMRSFAKDLDINAGTLSKVLRGIRKLSPEMFYKIGKAIGIDSKLMDKSFLNLDKDEKAHFHSMELDTFLITKDWYHDAILELSRTKYFKADPQWISIVLDIPEEDIKVAVERLIKYKLLKEENGKLVEVVGDTSLLGGLKTNTAQKMYQRQVLELSQESLQIYGKEKRSNSSMMMAINPNDLPVVRKKLKEFRRDLCSYLQREGRTLEEVYMLEMSFFPLTNSCNYLCEKDVG
jgi:transcriptional regulator with XRE-family HTH domain